MIVAMAMGANSLPSTPLRPSSGRKTRMMSIVA